jgi:hypothetical protein
VCFTHFTSAERLFAHVTNSHLGYYFPIAETTLAPHAHHHGGPNAAYHQPLHVHQVNIYNSNQHGGFAAAVLLNSMVNMVCESL